MRGRVGNHAASLKCLPSPPSPVPLQLRHHELRVEGGHEVFQGLGAGFEHLDYALGGDFAGQAGHHHVDLLVDQLLKGLLIAEGA